MKVNSFYLSVAGIFNFSVYDPSIISIDNASMIVALPQGFAWRIGHVAFDTVMGDDFDPAGEYTGDYNEPTSIRKLEVLLNEPVLLDADCVRAIQVPFSVVGDAGICIYNSVDLPESLAIPKGDYALVFEQFWKYEPETTEMPGDEEDLVTLYFLHGRLWFNSEKNIEPKILLQDPRDNRLAPSYPLSMDGKPL